jgi:hypothetical protein
MNRRVWKALPALLLVLFVLPSGPVGAAPGGSSGLRGPTVMPREFEFNALPHGVVRFTGPPREKTEGINPEADSIVAELKRHPRPPSRAEFSTLTLDPNAGGFQAFAPVIGNGFEGITQGLYIPSEPTVAGGPLNIFSTGNVSVTVTNKDGTNRVETNGQTFFGVPLAEGAISDAQCYYDALRGRFVALCFTQGTSPSNYSNFYLAISKTNDARGAWWQYKFDMTKDGSTQTTNWSDYQSLGVSEDKVAMTGQQFSFSANIYQYQKIRIIDRAAAYAGLPVTYVDFVAFSAPPGGDTNDNFVTKAARNLTAGDNTIHCLCVRTGSGSRVTYRTVTGPPGAPVLSAGNFVAVSAYSAPPDAVQKGTGVLVATNDCRPTDFYVRNGVLICAWHTSANIGGTVSALRLFRMRTSDRAVLTDETYGAAGTFYYYPAVTVDSIGTIFLGFDRSSSTEYPSCYATGKRRSDTTLEPSALLKAGLTYTTQSRWGDFTGIDNDASLAGPGGSTAWYAGQWSKGTSTFGTWINRLTFTYGQIAGSVLDDCDGSTGTTADRGPLAGVTVSLVQGVTTLATAVTDGSGNYSFGYLESGTYDVVVTPPAGGAALDAIPGTGGTTQTRIGAGDVRVDLTNAQTSTSNQFLVASAHAVPTTTNISPASKNVGDQAFSMIVDGTNFLNCSVVQLDGVSRGTTFGSANQLTASIPASDMFAPGVHAITVLSPAPGGGVSNGQTFTVVSSGDSVPPVVTLTAPGGGESWNVGSAQSITWSIADAGTITGVDIAYSTDGGASFPNVVASNIANSGSFPWTVPATPTTTARVRVLARDGGGNLGSDSSHVNFTISGWTVTASAGANGTITPSGSIVVPDGATPGFTIAPNTGCHVVDVLVNGISVGAVTSYTFTPIHANQSIAASFAVNTYTVTLATVGNGTATKVPDQPSYDYGTSVTLTATPASGWHFAAWSGDTSGTTNPVSLTITANKNITATFVQHIYTWNQTGSAAWGTAANWTPARTTPATDDELLFSAGGSVTATGVPTQTIGRLVLSNNGTVALQSGAAATLTLAGGTGTDLDVPSGCTLNLNGTSALTIALGASATAAVGGTVNVSGAAHRLVALGTNALAFQSGSLLSLGTGFTGNVFGTGSGTSALNSVIFQNGSLLSQAAGANPFGATAPNAVVTFQPGSRFRLDAGLTPSVSGRSYADFELNAAASIAPSGSVGFSMDSVIVSQGNLSLALTANGNLDGDIRVMPGATLTLGPGSGAPVYTLGGGAPQTISAMGGFGTTNFLSLAVNNTAGVTLGSDVTLSCPLSFTSGKITTGANVLAIDASGGVSGAAQGTGYVVGNLRRNFATGTSSQTFDIGDASFFTPVTVAVNGAASPFDVTAVTRAPDHAGLAGSPLDPAKSANRWWTLTPVGTPSFTSYDATFNFNAADLDAGANPANFVVARYDGAWAATGVGARTSTSTQATGVTAFSDFVVAEPRAYTLSLTTVGGGTVAKVPDQPTYTHGTSVQLTANPGAGWSFTGWSGDTVDTANPLTLVMIANKAITASFADTARPAVAVTYPNGGESLAIGSSATLTWTATDNGAVSSVDLLLSRAGAGGPYSPLLTGTANTGSYSWSVTGPASGTAFLVVVAHDTAGHAATDLSDAAFSIISTSGVDGAPVTEFALAPVWPNPVRLAGHTVFALPRPARVRLSVVDLQGREVMLLADGEYAAGRHPADFSDARMRGGFVPGLYFLRLQVPGRTIVRRFLLMR